MGRVLDSWVGETVVKDGRRYFEHNGVLRPDDVPRGLRLTLGDRARQFLARLQQRRAPAGLPMKFQPTMGQQGWEELLASIIADGTQISNTTTETIVAPDFAVPANFMAVGRVLRLSAFGVCSNVVTTPGTLTFRVRWGGVAGTLVAASAAIGLDTTARTNALWRLQAIIVCRSEGATGSFLSSGAVNVVNRLGSVGVSNNTAFGSFTDLLGSAGTPIASGSAAVTVDTTTAKLLSITAQFSVATSPTNLTCHQRLIEALN